MPAEPFEFDAGMFDPAALRDFKLNVFDALGYTPDPWQALFHDSTARHRILPCGTRVGKTFGLTPECVAGAVLPSKKSLETGEWVGARGWCVAPTYDLADKLFLPVARAIKRHFKFFIESYSERDRIVRLVGGGFVQGKSADNPDSLVGEELDWAVIDEAPRVGEHEKEMVKQRLLTRAGWFAAIGSPVPCKWFERDFHLGQGNGFRYEWTGDPIEGARFAGRNVRFVPGVGTPHQDYFSLMVPTHANRRIKLEDLLDLERTSPDRIFRQDVLAEFMSTEGAVFAHFEHLANAPRLAGGTLGQRYVVGWDIARARDYSVLSVFDRAAREQVWLERFQGSWEAQYARVARVCRRYSRPHLVYDGTGKGDPVGAELKRRNNLAAVKANDPGAEIGGAFAERIEPIDINTNRVKRDLVENLAAAVDQGTIRLLNDPVQMQEFRLYEFKQSDATGVVRYGAPPGFHDDTVMATALAWWRVSRPAGTTTFLMA